MAHLRRKHPELKVSCVDYGGVSEVQVRNVETGEVVTEPSIRALCRRFNWHYGSVHPLLKNGESEVKLFKGHQLRFACDDPWPEPKAAATADQIVQVTCKTSGIMKEFPSLRTAAAAYSVDRQKLQRMHKNPLDKDSFLVTIIKPG